MSTEVLVTEGRDSQGNQVQVLTSVEVQRTTFGAAVLPYPNSGRSYHQEIAAHEVDCGAQIGVLRIYDGGQPSDWFTPSGSGSNAPGDVPGAATREFYLSVKPSLTSTKAQLVTWLRAYLPTVPRRMVNGRLLRTMMSAWHEPSVKQLNPAQWIQFQINFLDAGHQVAAELGRGDEFEFGPCYDSRYHVLTGGSTYKEIDYMSAAIGALADFVAYDPYNEHSAQSNWAAQYQDPAFYLTHLEDLTEQYLPGVPKVIGETAYVTNPADLSMKPEWAGALAARSQSLGYRAVCWYDAMLSGGKPWWLRLNGATPGGPDLPSAQMWGALYSL